MRHSTIIITAILAALLVTSAFAEPRHDQRITAEGRVQTIHHERDGYRVQLDRNGYSFWVPEYVVRERLRDFRPGIVIRFGGVYRGGSVYVDVVDFQPYEEYDRHVLRGSIERIDDRNQQLLVREERTDRLIRVNFERDLRMFRFGNLRRGDFIQVSGAWLTPGLEFNAYRIEELSLR